MVACFSAADGTPQHSLDLHSIVADIFDGLSNGGLARTGRVLEVREFMDFSRLRVAAHRDVPCALFDVHGWLRTTVIDAQRRTSACQCGNCVPKMEGVLSSNCPDIEAMPATAAASATAATSAEDSRLIGVLPPERLCGRGE